MPDEGRNPHSTARIAGHPLHPMVIPFPIAFFVAVPVTDMLFLRNGQGGFAVASMWLLGAGIAGALLAAALGLIDFFGDRRIRSLRQAWMHMIGNLVAVALQLLNFALRTAEGGDAVTYGQAGLSGVVVLLLLFNGWMGWEMVYRRHVGVADDTPTFGAR